MDVLVRKHVMEFLKCFPQPLKHTPLEIVEGLVELLRYLNRDHHEYVIGFREYLAQFLQDVKKILLCSVAFLRYLN